MLLIAKGLASVAGGVTQMENVTSMFQRRGWINGTSLRKDVTLWMEEKVETCVHLGKDLQVN